MDLDSDAQPNLMAVAAEHAQIQLFEADRSRKHMSIVVDANGKGEVSLEQDAAATVAAPRALQPARSGTKRQQETASLTSDRPSTDLATSPSPTKKKKATLKVDKKEIKVYQDKPADLASASSQASAAQKSSTRPHHRRVAFL